MATLDRYAEDLIAHGKETFSTEAVQRALELSHEALQSSLKRAKHRGRIAGLWRNFFLIVRPEDRAMGAPDPIRWIGPLMKHLEGDYRISLLTAAARHGSSHQAAMRFQVVAPRQLRSFEIGRFRIDFLFQHPAAFASVNRPPLIVDFKSDAGLARGAGVELTLLDCTRYMTKAGGIGSVAQVVRDIGAAAKPKRLAQAAEAYENSVARRLGFLLDSFGHRRQADALRPAVKLAKSAKLLNPSTGRIFSDEHPPVDESWNLILNDHIEADD